MALAQYFQLFMKQGSAFTGHYRTQLAEIRVTFLFSQCNGKALMNLFFQFVGSSREFYANLCILSHLNKRANEDNIYKKHVF